MPKRELPPVPNTLSDDPYVFEDETNWNKVVTSSTDKRGFRERDQTYYPQGEAGMISKLIAKINHPAMRTVADFRRNGSYHAMEVFNHMDGIEDPDVTQWLAELEANTLREQVAQQREGTKQLVEDYAKGCQAAWDDEDYDMLRRDLITATKLVATMREPYKTKLLTLITKYDTKLTDLI